VPGKTWFTSRHHRETPHRIEQGEADVGIVWTTEVVHAKREGRAVEGVAIPAPYNQEQQVGYAIGVLADARNPDNAWLYMKYLASEAAQNIYASYGFGKAAEAELRPQPLADAMQAAK
jgi:ABC-type molybdate transport system substrate-binding protein